MGPQTHIQKETGARRAKTDIHNVAWNGYTYDLT